MHGGVRDLAASDSRSLRLTGGRERARDAGGGDAGREEGRQEMDWKSRDTTHTHISLPQQQQQNEIHRDTRSTAESEAACERRALFYQEDCLSHSIPGTRDAQRGLKDASSRTCESERERERGNLRGTQERRSLSLSHPLSREFRSPSDARFAWDHESSSRSRGRRCALVGYACTRAHMHASPAACLISLPVTRSAQDAGR